MATAELAPMLPATDLGTSRTLPDPEVSERARRRRFTAVFKLRILKEVDWCKDGELGALLRREGCYSSLPTTWRRQHDQGEMEALPHQARSVRPAIRSQPV